MNDHNPYESPDESSEKKRDRNTALIGVVSTVVIVVFVVLLVVAGAASFLLFQSGDPGLKSPVVTDTVEEPTIVPAKKEESK
jgi:flagellar basal body-associated protein FliL